LPGGGTGCCLWAAFAVADVIAIGIAGGVTGVEIGYVLTPYRGDQR
jgi:hypothetical protein